MSKKKQPTPEELAAQFEKMAEEAERKGAKKCQPGCVMIGKTMVHKQGCENFSKYLDKIFSK